MKNLGVVITDGVGFRNYILSDFLKEAEANYNVTIFSCLPKQVYKGFVHKAKIIELPVFQEKFPTWFFMKLKEVAHLRLNKSGNFGIQDSFNINRKFSNSNRGIAKRFIFFFTKFFKSEACINSYNKLQQSTFKNKPLTKKYIEFLKQNNIDFLYFTHQRPPYIAPLIYASEKLNIPNATFIFSWDNIASKGRMAGDFNYYFTWSNLMKSELLAFYKKVKQNQVKVVGTPQFEPYVLDRYKVERKHFIEKFNLDVNRKTICFSCGDISTSKNDELYIETIAKAIIENNITQKVNFLVRTSPAETPERFYGLKEKFPFIKWNYPKWPLSREGHQETWSQRVPTVEDMIDLRSILQYSDVFVNMCSTMSLDAMCFDKPVINPVFGNKQNGLYDDQRFLNYDHYKRVVESGAVAISKNREELISDINESLENNAIRLVAQEALIKIQVTHELPGTSNRIVETIKECLN